MKIAVIILHYGLIATTRNCLSKLKEKIGPHQVILINNTQDDLSPLTTIISGTQLINNPTNYGFARGVNQGISLALKDQSITHFFLMNNDLYLSVGNLQQLLLTFNKYFTAGIVSPVLHHALHYDWGGKYNCWTGMVHHKNWENKPKTTLSVSHVAGAAMLISHEVIVKFGLLDERFFLYFEDLDFCLREARDVEQIAEEFCEVVELVFDVIKFLAHVGRGLAELQELKRALNRCKGIAELVRKRCQEKVLCLVAFGYFVGQTSVVENDAEVVAEFFEEFEIVTCIHAAGARVSERKRAECVAERGNGNNHERFQAEALHRLQMLGGSCALPYRFVGNDGYELRLARADGRVKVARIFFGRGKTLLELKEVIGHLLVPVDDRNTFEAALLIEHINRAPVGERGHRQIGLFQEPGAEIDFHRKNLCRFQHETEFVFAGCDARHTGDVERDYVHVFI